MLFQAEKIAKLYAPLVAKAEPPSPLPQTDRLLSLASNWLSIDLATVQTDGRSVLRYLAEPVLWDTLAEMGIEAVELKGLKQQTSYQIDEQFGTEQDYALLFNTALKKEIRIIGKSLSGVTGQGVDFALALKNMGAYPELYSLVEIEPQDWNLLPDVKKSSLSANVPWMSVQTLHKKGYVPSHFDPYLKQSAWNATGPILGIDQKQRRWIYLRDSQGLPHLDWLNPSFGALRLAAADTLYSLFRLGQPILQLEGMPPNTETTLSLTIRKLGGFSAALTHGGVESLNGCTDASYDLLTPMASLHALIAQDASALRLMYDLVLEQNVPAKRLIHALEPFGRNPNDWAEFVHSPNKKHNYSEQECVASELRKRLLDEDRKCIKSGPSGLSWKRVGDTLTIRDLEKRREALFQIHVSLAQFFAWQPGVFSLSPEDLLGTAPEQKKIDLLGPNPECLYSCAPGQLSNPHSFASQLKKILRIRKELGIAKATLMQTIATEHKEVLLLRIELPGQKTALLAMNFSQAVVEETIESFAYAHTTAIDSWSGLAENKAFDSSFVKLRVEPFKTKFIVFQPKIHK